MQNNHENNFVEQKGSSRKPHHRNKICKVIRAPVKNKKWLELTKTFKKRVPVRVNVYGIDKVNQALAYTGLGIYHSGVEVYGNEYAYGGHEYPSSGIFKMLKPRDLKSLTNADGVFTFIQTLRIGYTTVTYAHLKLMISKMGEEEWRGDQYHLLYKNCNIFADYFCNVLCGRGLPSWVNRMASIVSKFPFVVTLIPKEYLTPKALEQQCSETKILSQQPEAKSTDEIRKCEQIATPREAMTAKNETSKTISAKQTALKVEVLKKNIPSIPKSQHIANRPTVVNAKKTDTTPEIRRHTNEVKAPTTTSPDNNLTVTIPKCKTIDKEPTGKQTLLSAPNTNKERIKKQVQIEEFDNITKTNQIKDFKVNLVHEDIQNECKDKPHGEFNTKTIAKEYKAEEDFTKEDSPNQKFNKEYFTKEHISAQEDLTQQDLIKEEIDNENSETEVLAKDDDLAKEDLVKENLDEEESERECLDKDDNNFGGKHITKYSRKYLVKQNTIQEKSIKEKSKSQKAKNGNSKKERSQSKKSKKEKSKSQSSKREKSQSKKEKSIKDKLIENCINYTQSITKSTLFNQDLGCVSTFATKHLSMMYTLSKTLNKANHTETDKKS